ncbi:MAG: type II toxin-antitoxin system VapC family toxin [Alphaproteobacteria bacterium]|nr:type II toxin-antitoxin system VapC family toxin [Alphaproteobacteria bacterium]
MRVVDTSAWIEWLLDSPTAKHLESLVPAPDAFIVPTMVQFELYKWLCREVSRQKAEEVMALTDKCIVVPLDSDLAIKAAHLSAQHRLSTADAIIFATTRERDAELLTCDAHFEGLPGVVYVEKQI